MSLANPHYSFHVFVALRVIYANQAILKRRNHNNMHVDLPDNIEEMVGNWDSDVPYNSDFVFESNNWHKAHPGQIEKCTIS